MTDRASTLERLLPDLVESGDATGQETLILHMERYAFAAKHIPASAKVLDLACGVGYGTRLMADSVEHPATFVGADVSSESIRYAKERYADERIDYIVTDGMTFSRPDFFDVIVSLETIEHLPRPGEFVRSVVESLKVNGLFVGSVPITPSVDANPHHLHDFTASSFRKLLADASLEEVDSLLQRQPFNPLAIVTCKEKRLSDMRRSLLSYYASHPRALLKRITSTLVDGFNNRYLTIVARKR
jgi:SAM-dependent methyltransferase